MHLDEAICEELLERPANSSTPLKSNQSVTANTTSIISDTSSTELSIISNSASTQTTQVLSFNTPRKRSLKAKVSELEKKIDQLEEKFKIQSKQLMETITSVDHFYEVCDSHLPPNLSLVIKNYVRMSQRKPQGFRYSSQLKQLALTIYFFGPMAYRFLKNILQLPSPRTLRRVTEKVEIVPGLNDVLFNCLEIKMKNLKDDAKDIVLCVDEMAIKTNLFYNLSKDYIIGFNNSYDTKTYECAKHVLCFMIRSLNYKWKQPVAYFFINNSCTGMALQNTIFAVISRLQSISLNIKVLTTDQGSNFYSFANKMHVSIERPYFFVNGEKIYYVFDAPHLLKSTRNNFFKYKFEILDSTTDKRFLDDFYKADQGLNRCAPKLTEAHINPGPFHKMKVRYASQVLSATVAAGMRSCIKCNTLPIAAETTAHFIENMDKLFDILNSKPKSEGGKEFNLPFKNSIKQKNHLIMMLNVFKNMRIIESKIINGITTNIDVTQRMKFINGWQITIKSLLQLWDDIEKPQYFLCTYRLNQDCLENLFGNFRNQNGNNVNPTPIQFYWSFKKIFFLNYLKHSDGSNCLEDLDLILTNIGEISPPLLNSNILFLEKTPFQFNNLNVGTLDYRELQLTSKNALTYVSGYLIKKCIEKHSCNTCLDFAKSQKSIDEAFIFIHLKAYQNEVASNYGNLNVPPDSFINYINALDDVFITNFPTIAIESNVGKKMKNLIDNVPFTHPCKSFSFDFLKKLYIRLRIYHAIKKINRDLLTTPRKNRKLNILSHL